MSLCAACNELTQVKILDREVHDGKVLLFEEEIVLVLPVPLEEPPQWILAELGVATSTGRYKERLTGGLVAHTPRPLRKSCSTNPVEAMGADTVVQAARGKPPSRVDKLLEVLGDDNDMDHAWVDPAGGALPPRH